MNFIRKPITLIRLPIRIGSRVTEGQNGDQVVVPVNDGQIYISAPGEARLGIIGDRLLLMQGLRKKLLAILHGRDIFADTFIQITSRTADQLGIVPGNQFVSYNQIMSVLRINPGK